MSIVATVVLVVVVVGVVVARQPRQSPAAAAAGCAPVAGQQLLVLRDDKQLEAADNLIPAVYVKVAKPTLINALDAVSAALDNQKLVQLEHAVAVDGQTPARAAAAFVKASGLTDRITKGPGGPIVIGSTDMSESPILAELYRIAVATAGYRPEIRKAGSRNQYEPSLEKGRLDVVPERLSELTEFLNVKLHTTPPTLLSSADPVQTMHDLRYMGQNYGLVFGAYSAAQNQRAFAVTKAFAQRYGVDSVSALATKCSGRASRLGGPSDCPRLPGCEPGLDRTYKMRVGSFTPLDDGGPKTKDALRAGEITVGMVFSADVDLAPR